MPIRGHSDLVDLEHLLAGPEIVAAAQEDNEKRLHALVPPHMKELFAHLDLDD